MYTMKHVCIFPISLSRSPPISSHHFPCTCVSICVHICIYICTIPSTVTVVHLYMYGGHPLEYMSLIKGHFLKTRIILAPQENIKYG